MQVGDNAGAVGNRAKSAERMLPQLDIQTRFFARLLLFC